MEEHEHVEAEHREEGAEEGQEHTPDAGDTHEEEHEHKPTAVEGATEVALIATEWAFTPETFTVKLGEPVTLVLVNEGIIEHEVEIPAFDLHLHTLPGATTMLTFVPDQVGSFEFACEIPGHRAAGMVGELVVVP